MDMKSIAIYSRAGKLRDEYHYVVEYSVYNNRLDIKTSTGYSWVLFLRAGESIAIAGNGEDWPTEG